MKEAEERAIHQTQVPFLLSLQQFLPEFVYGGIDGSITTFAVVAGAVGAGLDNSIIIILGFANLLADGLSMSIGAYLSAKSSLENFHKHQAIEYWEVENSPELEEQEIRDIYQKKGFKDPLLEQVVQVITADKDRWVAEMMKDELEMIKDDRSPFKIGLVTYISFILIGLIPLFTYVYQLIFEFNGDPFWATCLLTFLAFLLIGWLKSYITQSNRWKSILETVLLGAIAAAVAYSVGGWLEQLLK